MAAAGAGGGRRPQLPAYRPRQRDLRVPRRRPLPGRAVHLRRGAEQRTRRHRRPPAADRRHRHGDDDDQPHLLQQRRHGGGLRAAQRRHGDAAQPGHAVGDRLSSSRHVRVLNADNGGSGTGRDDAARFSYAAQVGGRRSSPARRARRARCASTTPAASCSGRRAGVGLRAGAVATARPPRHDRPLLTARQGAASFSGGERGAQRKVQARRDAEGARLVGQVADAGGRPRSRSSESRATSSVTLLTKNATSTALASARRGAG